MRLASSWWRVGRVTSSLTSNGLTDNQTGRCLDHDVVVEGTGSGGPGHVLFTNPCSGDGCRDWGCLIHEPVPIDSAE
jgi:hypothetical protein